MHTSLDVVEERLAAASTKTGAVVAGAGDSRELYLGSLCTQVRRTRTLALASQLMTWCLGDCELVLYCLSVLRSTRRCTAT